MGTRGMLLLLLLSPCLCSQSWKSTSSEGGEPKTAQGWSQLAYDRMSLRVPGQSPFHMKVAFHAFPGMEFRKAGQIPEILAGEGTYEETWMGPHQWRREVRLGPYHAVEVESERGRKIQASSDHEPSRVLMLMIALFSPGAPDAAAPAPVGVRIDHLVQGDRSLVRISTSRNLGSGATVQDSVYYSADGLLFLANKRGMVTSWEDAALFNGKYVPRHIAIKAVDRDLLTADVAVKAAGAIDPGTFDLPGGPAQPGMTLRPILRGFSPPGEVVGSPDWTDNPGAAISLFGVLDRTGKIRDLELIMNVNGHNLEKALDSFRKSRSSPAELDGSPCEIPIYPLATSSSSRMTSTLQ